MSIRLGGASSAAGNYVSRLKTLEGQTVYTYGHSYNVVGGAALFHSRLAYRENCSIAQRGQSGNLMTQTLLDVKSSWTPNSRGLATVVSLINDVDAYGIAANGPTTSAEAFRTICAYLTASAVLAYTDASHAFGTGWTSGATTTNGSYYDFAWNGDTAHLLLGFVSGAGSTVTVSRSGDGATVATVNTGGYQTSFTGAVKLSGFGAGAHTVRVTLTSGGALSVVGAAIPADTPPNVVLVAEGPVNSYGRAGAGNVSQKNAALTASYIPGCQTVAATFTGVVVAVPTVSWDAAAMLLPDGIHPNDKGHSYYCDQIQAALVSVGFRQGLTYLSLTTAGTAYSGTTPSYAVNGAPSQVGTVATTPGAAQVALSWSAPANNGSAITDYLVQYRTPAGSGTWTTFAEGTSTTTTATVTGLTNGATYGFRVAAVNGNGTSAYSAEVSDTPSAAATVPGAPTTLTATAGDTQAVLSWSAPASNGGSAITDYAVQYRTTSGPGSWTTFADGTSTATTATVTGLTNGTSYDFQVAAVNSVGAGSYSSATSATPTVPASFDANNYTGLKGWFKADALSLSDGATVTSWADSTTGNPTPLSVPSGTTAPVYKATAGPNSKPIVRFVKANTNALQSTASIVAPTTVTTFIVCAITGSNQQFLFNLGGPANTGGQSQNKTMISGYNAGVVENFDNPRMNVGTWTNGVFAIFEFVNDSGANSSTGLKNGTVTATSNYGAQGINGPITLGSTPSPALGPADVDIAEFIAYAGTLSSANRSAIRAALGTKYGITVV